MKQIKIKENSWLAKMAARKLKCHRMAMVIGHTIYLYGATKETFLASRRWVLHELMHVHQYEREGLFRFLFLYLADYFKVGYWQNRFEVEARLAETNEALAAKYRLPLHK